MQYVQKYSAAYWGTSFVGEMNKIRKEGIANVHLDSAAQEEAKHADVAGSAKLAPPSANANGIAVSS